MSTTSRWSDADLEQMRLRGDAPLDEALHAAFRSGAIADARAFMGRLMRATRLADLNLPQPVSDAFVQPSWLN